jgi:regulator of PEP synthase PpsR (kinase-PPPase family)
MKFFHLHLVSDSTGDTVSSIARATLVQFKDVEAEEHIWSLIRTKGQIEKIIDSLQENPGVVMYTISNPKLRDMLTDGCSKLNIVCIPVLNRAIRELSAYLGQNVSEESGRQYELDEDYFDRVDAISFALSHDDGQSTWDLKKAQILLIGVSRTSKSPTCMYLAFRGYWAANIPFINTCTFPVDIAEVKKNSFVVGLTINPDRLMQIRKNRLLSMQSDDDTDYVDMDKIKEEITDMRKLLLPHNCMTIDVTRRSVEETAAAIIQQYHEWRNKRIGSYENNMIHGKINDEN